MRTLVVERLMLILILHRAQVNSYVNQIDGRRPLTQEQRDFLTELAEYDDALWDRETKSLFEQYSQVLGGSTTAVSRSDGEVQPESDSSVIVLRLPESALYTPEGINLTALIQTLNQQMITQQGGTVEREEERTTRPETRTRAPVLETTTLKNVDTRAEGANNNTVESVTEPGSRNASTTPDNHIFRQVQKIINASAQRNISGILDASLGIATNGEISNFVQGIFGLVYCNSINRLLGRC